MFGSIIDNAISDFFYRPFTRTYKPGDPHTLPIMGITVSQAEHDALKEDLQGRLKKRDELITKLANDLQEEKQEVSKLAVLLTQAQARLIEANDSIEKMSIEIDTLQKRLARRKQSPRETGVKP